jgi:hypothetical protein
MVGLSLEACAYGPARGGWQLAYWRVGVGSD